MSAHYLLIMLIIAGLICIFLYMQLWICQSRLDGLLQLKGKYEAIVENKESGTTSQLVTTKDKLLEVHEKRATDEGARSRDCEKKVNKLEEERDSLNKELSKVNKDYATVSNNYEHCRAKCDC